MRSLTSAQLSFINQYARQGITDELEIAHRMLALDDLLYLESHETKTWEGWSIRQVSEAVKSHLKNIRQKLGMTDRVRLAICAIHAGI